RAAVNSPAALALVVLFAQATPTVPVGSLSSEMDRLQVREALVLPSQAVDEEPIWAPKGDFLAVNVEGKWMKVNLLLIRLEPATWHSGQPIGIINSKSSVSSASEQDVKEWSRGSRADFERVQAKNGTVVELRHSDLSTSLVITRKGKDPEL